MEDTRSKLSNKPVRSQRRAASATQSGPGSSALAATRSVLTPERPRMRSSSTHCPATDAGTSPIADATVIEANNDVDMQIDTPTKSPRRRGRPKSSETRRPQGSSSDLQARALEAEYGSNQGGTGNGRPSLGSSYTSPEMHARTPSRNQRPTVTERSASEPVTPGKKLLLSGFQLDGDIAKLIEDGPKGEKSREKEKGSIYFYKVKPRDSEVNLMKIGRTQSHPKKRLRQIQGICKHLVCEEHAKAIARDVPFHGFAEKLIHTELSNYQHKFKCVCGTEHTEYFQVSEEIAVKVFERWRDFCHEEPWDAKGIILPMWARRLQNRTKFGGPETLDFDHHEFSGPWDAFISPTSFERFLSDAILVWELAFPNRWMIISLAELLTIVCISRQSFWTSVWTMIIVFFLLADLVITENLHTTSHITQLMSGGLQSSPARQKPPVNKSAADSEEVVSENNPESASCQHNNEEVLTHTEEESFATPYRPQVETRQAVDDNLKHVAESRAFTDIGYDWDGDSDPPTDPEVPDVDEMEVTEDSA